VGQVSEERIPTRAEMAVFYVKAFLLQRARGVRNLIEGIGRCKQRLDEPEGGGGELLAESRTALWTDPNPREGWYQRGKVQNLRRAALWLDGAEIRAGEIFSFWKQVGKATARRGFAPGRMLLEGCMIPAVGGGLCQLSNALYQVAADADCEIVERHRHSRVVPGSATAEGRDATVAWNYIDLRFRPKRRVRFSVKLTARELVVRVWSTDGDEKPAPDAKDLIKKQNSEEKSRKSLPIYSDHACDSCGKVVCHLHAPEVVELWSKQRTAFLLDGVWPEFAEFVKVRRGENDLLAIPLDGVRWKRPQYAWPMEGFARVETATQQTLVRACRSRRLAAQGAERQRALLKGAEELARAYAKKLTPDVDALVVAQPLLPFLWRMGVLGGRRVSVMMMQMPIATLEMTLDQAAAAHPESKTLKDFRAESWLSEAETRALEEAEEIVTPHAAIAALFPGKARLLDWKLPEVARVERKRDGPMRILFPASTLGRKGAFELREALVGLRGETEFILLLGGRELEGEGFWKGLPVESAREVDFASVDLVVLPTIVESQPRSLLRALAAGVPVITTVESGLHAECGARFVPMMDAELLRAEILRTIMKN